MAAGWTRRAAIAGFLTSPAYAAAPPLPADRAWVDGAEFRLTDILAPEPDAPFGQIAVRIRDGLLAGSSWRPRVIAEDRWRRPMGALIAAAGDSLQGALIDAGAARVRPETDDRGFIAGLLAREDAARRAGRGLWALDDYRVRDAGAPKDVSAGYQIMEGVLKRAGRGGARLYLNFGDDYRSDVTASFPRSARRRIFPDDADAIEKGALGGAPLRLRGFVFTLNGPAIELDHPDQVERLAPSA